MAKQENPFINLDFQKMMTDFKMPGIDADALMNAQQKNIEAIASGRPDCQAGRDREDHDRAHGDEPP